ncbi:MAG: McrC family protein [Paludibacteraceae bacterium]|nr:McrC family protein [Paludibacteraceae bacterium]
MKIIQLREQTPEKNILQLDEDCLLNYLEDGENRIYSVQRGRENNELCLKLERIDNDIFVTSSYFVGLDWLKVNELAVQVVPKMNDGFEVDYSKMLNEALQEPENFEHLQDLLTVDFTKPSVEISQYQDTLSVFLVTEYLNLLYHLVKKGLKKSFYAIENNLEGKIKGRLLVAKNIHQNLMRGHVANNVCSYEILDVDSKENRILKKAFRFCCRQLEVFDNAFDTGELKKMVRFINPYFESVGDVVDVNTIVHIKINPIFKDYSRTLKYAQLLLHRYSYNISDIGRIKVKTPPFWIDMSKLFELYVFHRLRKVFTGKKEIFYHLKSHRQELDYLLNPQVWPEPYVIDAKYKPRYKTSTSILMDDAREVSGYARLSNIYKRLGLEEDRTLPIKCLIIYPDQSAKDYFSFTRMKEPDFEKIGGYVRMYKLGIRLPIVEKT